MSKIIHYSLNNPRLLPSGYTPLSYIEGTGSSWFSTNLKPTNNTSFYIKCVWNSKSGWNMMFGAWSECCIAADNSVIYINGVSINQTATLGNIYEIYSTSSNSYINSSTALSPKVAAKDSNLAIFGACSVNASDKDWRNDGTRWGAGVGKIYEVKIWDNGVIKRDLYPAKNSSNVPGMFDLVEQKFYSSATTTAFIAGPELPIGLPAEYTPVEWIKTGTTTTTCTNTNITCYRNSDMMPGIYTRSNTTPFVAKSGYVLGPTTRDEGREWNGVSGQNLIDNNIENWTWVKNTSYSNGMSWTKNGSQVDLKNSTTQTNASALGVYKSYPVCKDATYSWSVEVKASAAINNVRIGTGTFNLTTSWQRVSMATTPTGNTSAFCVYVNNWPTNLTISLRKVKLEYGSQATPYGVESPGLCSSTCRYSASSPSTSTSPYDGSTSFNNSYVIVKNLPTFNNAISFSFWMKPENTAQSGCIFNYRTETGGDFGIFLTNGKIRFDAGGQSTFNYTYTTNWQHVCLTYNKVKKCLYINGVLQQEIALTTAINCTATIGSIGLSSSNAYPSGNALNAYLKDFEIYDHALSLTEIQQLAANKP